MIYVVDQSSAGMAKDKRRSRKYRRYLRGAVDIDVELTTLAAKTATSENLADFVTEKAWLSSVVASWDLSTFTKSTGDGPIQCGVAHSDYSSAEIEEWIENLGSWEEADMIAQEVGKRKIRMVGVFETPDDATEVAHLNDGKPIRTKCGWMLSSGQTLKVWGYNMGSGALETTVPVIQVLGHCNLWPA